MMPLYRLGLRISMDRNTVYNVLCCTMNTKLYFWGTNVSGRIRKLYCLPVFLNLTTVPARFCDASHDCGGGCVILLLRFELDVSR